MTGRFKLGVHLPHKSIVRVRVPGVRELVLGNGLVRVDPGFALRTGRSQSLSE